MARVSPPTNEAAQYHVDRPDGREGFNIAIICALGTESDAVEALFDEFWEKDHSRYGKAPNDPNSYTLGRIGPHNVVLAYMPGMGTTSSASVAPTVRISFSNIRLALVVGICGAVPDPIGYDRKIYLGDVIISTGIVQTDFGWQYSDRVKRKDSSHDSPGRPNSEIRAFLERMKGQRAQMQLQQRIPEYIAQITSTKRFEDWTRPALSEDRLFERTYRHKHQNPAACTECARCQTANDPVCNNALRASCTETGCSQQHLLLRTRTHAEISLHFGRVACSNQVVKSAIHRDRIADEDSVIGFEMEGAGVWDNLPTIVIKSASDYADSHKNKAWQKYAAITAAACAKSFLQEWPTTDPPSTASTMSVARRWDSFGSPEAVFYNYGAAPKNQTNNQYIAGDMNFY